MKQHPTRREERPRVTHSAADPGPGVFCNSNASAKPWQGIPMPVPVPVPVPMSIHGNVNVNANQSAKGKSGCWTLLFHMVLWDVDSTGMICIQYRSRSPSTPCTRCTRVILTCEYCWHGSQYLGIAVCSVEIWMEKGGPG